LFERNSSYLQFQNISLLETSLKGALIALNKEELILNWSFE